MSYDPRAHGADCDRCVLRDMRDGGPVPCEWRGSSISIITEAPGEAEVLMNRPLVGPGGVELNNTIVAAGYTRETVNLHHALACRPPANKLKAVVAKLAKDNRKRKERGEAPLPTPMECCRPRLLNEIADVGNLLLLGKTAYETVMPGPHRSIDRVQGSLMDGPGIDGKKRKVVPVVHPGRVLKEQRWRLPFRVGVERALRWFHGLLRWEEPRIVTVSTPTEARWFIDHCVPWLKQHAWITYDTETNDIEPLRTELRTIQFGNTNFAVVVAFKCIETGRNFFSGHLLTELATACVDVLESDVALVGHNAGSYDRQVVAVSILSRIVGRVVVPRLDIDTVVVHRYVDPDLNHNLGFVGSLYTDVHDWKGDGKDPEDNATFWRYGALDTVVNARIVAPLMAQVDERMERVSKATAAIRPKCPTNVAGAAGSATCSRLPVNRRGLVDPVLWHDHQMQSVCVDMHAIGWKVNQERRAWAEAVLIAEERKWLNRLQKIMVDAGYADLAGWESDDLALEYDAAGSEKERARVVKKILKLGDYYDFKGGPKFNPRSGDAMRELLFGRWDLALPEQIKDLSAAKVLRMTMTESGDPVVDDMILRAYLADPTLSAEQHRIIHAARRAKKMRTLHGRFLRRLVPFSEWEEGRRKWIAAGKDSQKYPGIVVWEDGRARFGWNAVGTNVGRLSAGGKPARINPQTFPDSLRFVFEPEEGNVFVGADLDSIHVRLIANLWKIPSLVDGYTREGKAFDPHAQMARLCFAEKFENAPGFKGRDGNADWKGQAKGMRGTGKSLRFAGAYGADVSTIHATMTRNEDDDGNLTNRELKLKDVRALYERWMGHEPEWRRSWDTEIAHFRDNGFMLSPLLGRRMDFMDGEDRNKLINSRILSGEGDIMGPATVRVHGRIPRNAWGPNTGLIGQFHDAMVVEVPEHRAQEAKEILEAEMNVVVDGWPVPITATGKIGRNLKEV